MTQFDHKKLDRDINRIKWTARVFWIVTVPLIWFVCLYYASYRFHDYPVNSKWVWEDKFPNDTTIILKVTNDSIFYKVNTNYYESQDEIYEFKFFHKYHTRVE